MNTFSATTRIRTLTSSAAKGAMTSAIWSSSRLDAIVTGVYGIDSLQVEPKCSGSQTLKVFSLEGSVIDVAMQTIVIVVRTDMELVASSHRHQSLQPYHLLLLKIIHTAKRGELLIRMENFTPKTAKNGNTPNPY